MERFVMRRTLIAVAAVSAASLASSAFAGFSFTATQGTDGPFTTFLIRAINDGNGTGTELDGFDITYTLNAGNNAIFNVVDDDFNGVPDRADIVNAGNAPQKSLIRVGGAGTTSIVSTTPSLTGEPNPWGAINTWSVAAISTGAETATGAGAVIARLIMGGTAPYGGVITGQIGGNEGDAVPVNFTFGEGVGPGNVAPVVALSQNSVSIDIASQTAFGPVNVSATDADNNLASLVAGTVPATIADNISITGPGTGPLSLSGTGFTAADVGTYTIDFTATDSGNPALSDMDTFTLTITNTIPEPTTLAALAGFGLLALRRRK